MDAPLSTGNHAPNRVHGCGTLPSMEFAVMPKSDHQVEAGARLRAAIDAAGLTYVQAGEIMGASKSNVGNWMRGDAPINPYALYRFCRITGCTADWILLGDPSGLPQRLARQLAQAAPEPQSAD